VPTIADELDVRVPWRLDGTSLFAGGRQPPSQIVVRSYTGDVVKVAWAKVESGQRQTLERKIRSFGSGEDSLFAEGADRRLLGRSILTFPNSRGTTIHARVGQPSTVRFDPRSDIAPSRVTGTVTGAPGGQVMKLAIAVNGRIAAVTRTTGTGGKSWFSTFVPDSYLRPGVNTFTVLVMRMAENGELALTQIGAKGSVAQLAAAGP
jgi:hypothetical protein